jgi:WD40 repeat protein
LGDPLPPDALQRLGTVRYRHSFATTPGDQPLLGGKTLLVNTADEVHWVELATRRPIKIWPLPRSHSVCGFSHDGELTVLHEGQNLAVWDLTARKELKRLEVRGDLGLQFAAYFSPDKELIAGSSSGRHGPGLVRVWELATGKELWQEGVLDTEHRGLELLGFLNDQQTLVVLDKSSNHMSLRARATGKERLWFVTMPRDDTRSAALTADRKTVLIGTTGSAARAWDVFTGREIACLDGRRGSAALVAASRDSRTILTGGRDPIMHVWDWPEARLRRKIDLGKIGERGIQNLAVSADGKRAEVVLGGESAVRLWDLKTGKELPPPLEGHRGPILGMALSHDGTLATWGTDNTIRFWELRTGRHLRELATPYPLDTSALACNPDEHVLATANFRGGPVMLRERDTLRPVRTIDVTGQQVRELAFMPPGQCLAMGGSYVKSRADRQPSFVALWDVKTGQERHRLDGVGAFRLADAFSPDGQLFVEQAQEELRLWDIGSGLRQQTLAQKLARCFCFSPDGRCLVCGDWNSTALIIWELASGRERIRMDAPGEECDHVCYAPDGKWLARQSGRSIELWDVRRGQKIHTFSGHDGWVSGLAFGRDGRTLVSCSHDTTGLVWDVASVLARQPRRAIQPEAGDMTTAWNELANPDAKVAYRAAMLMVEAPTPSLALLRKHWKPLAHPSQKEIGALLAKLDSDVAAERERAVRELERMGDLVEGPVQRFLARRPTGEARLQAEQLLARAKGPIVDPDRLRQWRVVEVLECIGSTEASRLLRRMGESAQDARLSHAISAALKRSERRP